MSARRGAIRACAMLAALASSAGGARANDTRIAIESYVGVRPAEVGRVMAYLGTALEQWGFTAEPTALEKQLGGHVVSPGLEDPRFTAQTFSKQVEEGLNAVVNEQYQLAVRVLASALDGANRNSLVLARDPKSRESRLEALIYLARAHKHLGNAAARDEVMIEVMRSYPDKVITAKKYGPDAEEIYEAVKRNVDRSGRGRLSIEVTDPDAVIYVDETVRGRGKTLLGDMLPGAHRVLVDGPSGASRQYRVTVLASQQTRLPIDWDVDSVLVTGDWVGFQLATEKDREREGLLARRLAGDHTSAVMVAVVSAARINRRLVVSGAVHTVASGRIARSGQVELTGRGDNKKLDQLAAYLGFQEAGQDVAVIDRPPPEVGPLREPPPRLPPASTTPPDASPPAPPAPGRAVPPPGPSHAGEWILGGAGATAIVAGALLIAIDGTGTCHPFAPARQCLASWDTKLIGASALIPGVVLIAAAAALHRRHSKHRGPAIAAAPLAGGALGLVGWSFR